VISAFIAKHGPALKVRLRRLGLRRPAELQARMRRYVQSRLLARAHPRFGKAQLCEALASVGVAKCPVLFVHCAWDEFYNFEGTPPDLIEVLRSCLADDGTLAMPAYPLHIDPSKTFDVRRTPTGAGILAEIFRRSPEVRRGTHLFHSVTALGPHAEFLVGDHHKSLTSWDRNSPYARLHDVDATILCVGLPKSFGLGTSMHCPESLLYDEHPYFRSVFGKPVTYRYRDQFGQEGMHTILPRTGQWRATRVLRHMDPTQVRVTQISNVRLQAVSARYLIDRMVELARQGIVCYFNPKPGRSFKASWKKPEQGG
jgi:aminoglycoside 3-N-acetyltransferase